MGFLTLPLSNRATDHKATNMIRGTGAKSINRIPQRASGRVNATVKGQPVKPNAFRRKPVRRIMCLKTAAQVGPFAGKNIRGNPVTPRKFREPLLSSALQTSAPGTNRYSIQLPPQQAVQTKEANALDRFPTSGRRQIVKLPEDARGGCPRVGTITMVIRVLPVLTFVFFKTQTTRAAKIIM